jgi:murein DD-endopeptidase MepM/ murein hydrolase activator NlpD
MRVSAEFKRRARTFGMGAACGFIAGAMLVGVLVWKYGNSAGPIRPRSASIAVEGSTAAGQGSADGLADVDAPVLEGARPAPGATAATSGTGGTPPPNGAISPAPAPDHDATLTPVPPAELTARHLDVPVEGVRRDQLVRTFEQKRSGTRLHEAIDILAPRNTPVKAVEDGTIARLFLSKAGGITIYQFDPTETYSYYYAHLERYADGLKEGDHVKKGQILGYVGTSGNAPKETPHLHFAVFRLTEARHWWEGTPIDPYDILK